MRRGTEGSRPGATHCGHAVQIHDDAHELACRVATFLGDGLERGEPGLAVVTASHRAALVDELERRELGADAHADGGLLTFADAEGTLASFLENSGPSAARFHTVVGGLITAVGRLQPGTPVRVFGEMVDLLAQRGRHDAALALEELWAGLVHRRGLSLLCAYRLDLFDPEVQRTVLPAVYRAHDRVEPALEPRRLERAVDAALAETLGGEEAERVRRVAADTRRDAHVPAAELALMWVSARMPAVAGRILASARAAYESPALTPAR